MKPNTYMFHHDFMGATIFFEITYESSKYDNFLVIVENIPYFLICLYLHVHTNDDIHVKNRQMSSYSLLLLYFLEFINNAGKL